MFSFSSCYICSNDYSGVMTAYGAGNDNNLNTVKAGPGTIYQVQGKSPKEVHSLTIVGDVDSSVQNQTYTYISGVAANSEFNYHMLTLSGMTPCDNVHIS